MTFCCRFKCSLLIAILWPISEAAISHSAEAPILSLAAPEPLISTTYLSTCRLAGNERIIIPGGGTEEKKGSLFKEWLIIRLTWQHQERLNSLKWIIIISAEGENSSRRHTLRYSRLDVQGTICLWQPGRRFLKDTTLSTHFRTLLWWVSM